MSKSFEKNFIGGKFVKRTVCEVLREIYWYTSDEIVREKVKEAMGMAKRMDARLRQYKKDRDKEEWEDVNDPERVSAERLKQYKEEK